MTSSQMSLDLSTGVNNERIIILTGKMEITKWMQILRWRSRELKTDHQTAYIWNGTLAYTLTEYSAVHTTAYYCFIYVQ